ncbi:creatininase family protein [Mycobacterium sp. CVI_P3]|uniref:Creatininase family protein n=1 Tax=Mycobacterium pinniadriaticum TaxID=2994102 RepID=A0ABT3SAI6_9MYCO|nr:creatininase family protein [Mycobacterium pinniadriaticum]MCX2929463.1 creatininase family protein [Mycobacterium pinniadriaticum]MCX2935887.1 creatininase family protein [Mycobacterium pinniadriaticum]
MQVRELEKMTSPEVRAAIDGGQDTAVIAFGSLEQHGEHLPIGTDAFLGDEFGHRVAAHLNAILIPTVRVGFAEHHMPFAGTMTLSKETVRRIAVEYAHSLARHGFRRIVFVPTHGGNIEPLAHAVQDCMELKGVSVISVVSNFSRQVLQEGTVGVAANLGIPPEESGAHAGEWETSIMLKLTPDLVQMDRAQAGYTGDMGAGVEALLADGTPIDELTPTGVLGDPRRAEADRGEAYIQALTNVAVSVLEEK